ncbi:hypothetical protein TTHERM_00224560 (macronuclear) [Tetrahymena thermophila SB210]|uniref:Uncharacterized protein n=1 Tax=Tetrahymena thermophila (strain SB210) TaxID=312017 RepID=Q23C27_TETTS|nr:hypothetical protein TTHERM_00224560 [Tetrahymena thermophila SB210]EAR93941.1 hypothetical protein TTHERM_00224560 [Tetrahymena thermophila SB210]|eukprot:XP_001014186.1 hypothetical protein TTHERM_00224560 [Tetrahymena thermophila SB210]
MGQLNSTPQENIFKQYSANIKPTNYNEFLKKNRYYSQRQYLYNDYLKEEADEIFIVQKRSSLFDQPYAYKQQLLDIISQLKDFQDNKFQTVFKNDLERYFKEVKIQDKIRKIFDSSRESYLSERYNEKNKPIHTFVEKKFKKYNGNTNKTDEWGYKYSISDSFCLTLPAQFVYSEDSKSYKLKGKLTNQYSEFPKMEEFENQISQLVNFLSDKIKITHECFKNAQYSEQLFSDTKKDLIFDKEIRAQISIFEMEISPQQNYIGSTHKEGLSVEGIMYSCLYIPYQDKDLEATIEFKRFFEEKEMNTQFLKCQLYHLHNIDSDKKYLNKLTLPLGSVKLEEDLMIIFPNRNMHRVLIKNNSDIVQKRIVVQLSIVNHIDQPFTINDLDIWYNHHDELNDISYDIKKMNLKNTNTQNNINKLSQLTDTVTFVN